MFFNDYNMYIIFRFKIYILWFGLKFLFYYFQILIIIISYNLFISIVVAIINSESHYFLSI